MATYSFSGAPIYTLCVPKETTWEPEQAFYLMQTLLSTFPKLAFQIVGNSDGVEWRVIDLSGNRRHIDTSVLKAQYAGQMDVRNTVYARQTNIPDFFWIIDEYKLRTNSNYPLLFVDEIRHIDPLAGLIQTLSYLQAGERVTFTILIEREYKPLVHGLLTLAGHLASIPTEKHPFAHIRGTREAILDAKLNQPWYECYATVNVHVPRTKEGQERCGYWRDVLQSQLQQFDRNLPQHPHNGLVLYSSIKRSDITGEYPDDALFHYFSSRDTNDPKVAKQWEQRYMYLGAQELAVLWHLPHQAFGNAKVKWMLKTVEVPANIAQNTQGIQLGQGMYQGQLVHVRLLPQDHAGHSHILGATGTGKSTLLEHLINQDIQSGAGIAVVDPHGSLVRRIIRTSIPKEREGDVVVLDLANSQFPPPLNTLRGRLGGTATGRVMNVIQRLFPETTQYARLSMYLQSALETLQADPTATVRDIVRVFEDYGYRDSLLDKITNDSVLDTWDKYDNVSGDEQRQILAPIASRLNPFYRNEFLYPVLCHPDTLDFRQLISDKKILLISLNMNDDEVAETERDLIGALLIARLQVSGMGKPQEPFFIYIDEVQRFMTSSLDVMLSEARKFGLSLTISHQYLGQLKDSTLEAILGNVSTSVLFQCSPTDARAYAAYMKPKFQTEDLVGLNKYEAAIRLRHEDTTQPAFLLKTLPPIKELEDADERERRIRDLSISRYTPKSIDEVRSWLRSRYPRKGRRSPDQPPRSDDDTFFES